ncbi:Peptidyl-prolyl cis-trans isomerase A [Planctomycetes bacterium MalM25]|nr:Peptidyl-prolyl cis-trans isomerase A [Planctomycetes bacterium MalM25]
MSAWFRRRDRSKRAGRRGRAGSERLRTERLETRLALSAQPVGEALLVNDYLPGEQTSNEASIAVAASPVNRVVVFEGEGAVDDAGVFARVYDADGEAVGDAFRVNSTIRGEQYAPAVAVADDGDFIVAWAGRGVGDKEGIFLQRFAADGTRVGEEVIVNTTLGGRQTTPSLAMGDGDSFVVAWEGVGRGDSTGVFFRRFNSEGALGTEARVNTTIDSKQQGASATFLSSGEVVIAWQSRHQDGSDWGVYSQTYNSVGLAVGGETQLSETTTASQSAPAIVADDSGGYVAAWQSLNQDGDGWGIVGRRFGSDGAAAGSEIVVNQTTSGQQVAPALAVAEDGQWLAAWASSTPAMGWNTEVRSVEADDTLSDVTVVNEQEPGAAPVAPAIAVNEEDAWVVWSGAGASDANGVFSQALAVTLVDDGDPVAPVIDAVGDRETEVGTPIEILVTATDANSRDVLTFELDAAMSPATATIEKTSDTTAVIRWTPAESDDGSTVDFRIVVTDDADPALSSSEDFSVEVTDVPVSVDLNGAAEDITILPVDFLIGDAALQSLVPEAEILGANDATIHSASIFFATIPTNTAEVLSVSTEGTSITASYDDDTGRLSLLGVDSVANYERVLRTLIYSNPDPAAGETRAIAFQVTDTHRTSDFSFLQIEMVQPDLVGLAQAIADSGAVFYGAGWCPACTAQKELFEDGAGSLPFVEVTNPDRSRNQIGEDNNINTYPTWVFSDGTRAEGFQTLARLAELAGVDVPTSEDPHLAELADETLLVGSPSFIALDGYNSMGGELTYSVSSDNPDVTATILDGNRSAVIDVAGYGDLVFELFEDFAPRATDRLIELAEADFYDDVIFHRVVDGFVIQGGDPTGTGTGGSTLGTYDDQFHPDVQHNRTGLLSMAKNLDDTNDSQFFITEGATRSLDFQHTIFGVLVEGESNREAISQTQRVRQLDPSDPDFDDGQITGDRPVNEITMNDVSIIEDAENAVLFLKAADGATGTATITVTVMNEAGRSVERQFTVTLTPDTVNGAPFLEDLPAIASLQGQDAVFQLSAIDVEDDPVFYTARAISSEGHTASVSATGEVTVTPPSDDFVGTVRVQVSVASFPTVSPSSSSSDIQEVLVEFTASNS